MSMSVGAVPSRGADVPPPAYTPPNRPIDRLFNRLIQAQRKRIVGRIVRQLLKLRGVDIPPEALAPGTGLVLRHAGNVVVHTHTSLGSYVMLHQGVTIGRSDVWRPPHPEFGGFIVEDYAVLGANSVVTCSRGVITVATGSVLGANSVLLESTGPWEIWAGVPARRVGMREREVGLAD